MDKENILKLKRTNLENRRYKNTIDTFLVNITKKAIKENLSIEELKDMFNLFHYLCIDLHKVDENITETKLLATGSVMLEETLKQINDGTALSNHKVREIILQLMNDLSSKPKGDDLYISAISYICIIGAVLNKYILTNNHEITGDNIGSII
jgi:hypothetical protein